MNARAFPMLRLREDWERRCTEALTEMSFSGIPFLVGGGYALQRYTGTERHAKDLDVFVMRADVHRVLNVFRHLGHRTELPFPHWLGKVFVDGFLMDVIFSSGNGVSRVDQAWFEHSRADELCGLRVRLCPPEELIWSKAFVQERERFDGADVLHLLRHVGHSLDWPRLLARFGPRWRVLLSHLVLFGFAYPSQRHQIPEWVMDKLTRCLLDEASEPENATCDGTLLSREQYLDDLTDGYQDGRLEPNGSMTAREVAIWTRAIERRRQSVKLRGSYPGLPAQTQMH